MNYARAAINAKPSESIAPRSKQPSSHWTDLRTKRQRQIEAWRRARQCLKEAGALKDA
jgi:hypothetical protein